MSTPFRLAIAGLLAISFTGCSGRTSPAPSASVAPSDSRSVSASASASSTRVTLTTSKGDITIELDVEKAPLSSANFLTYANAGYYDGLIFHRVIKGFMIQAGAFSQNAEGTLNMKEPGAPIQNESRNGLKNVRGSIAMARRADPNSANSQFFINHGNNGNLDFPSFDGHGYAVFGKVVDGMDVVDAIATVKTGRQGGMGDVPTEPITIQKTIVITP